MKRVPFLTFFFGALAVAIHASPELTNALQFDRSAFLRGEIWRLFTGHFSHFGTDHLRWDVIAFVAFGSLVEIRSRRAWMACLGISAVVIVLGIVWFQPQFSIYRGLSGLDSAFFAFVTADLVRSGRRAGDRAVVIFGVLALGGFVAKSVYELTTGLTLFVEPNPAFQAVPLAHLIGAATGVLTAQDWRSKRPLAADSSTDLREDLLNQ